MKKMKNTQMKEDWKKCKFYDWKYFGAFDYDLIAIRHKLHREKEIEPNLWFKNPLPFFRLFGVKW